MGRVEQKATFGRDVLDLRCREHGRQRQAGAECLGKRQVLRHDAIALAGEQLTCAAESGLRLVENELHLAVAALLRQRRHVALGRFEHAAGAQDRLDNAGGQRAGRLAVDQLEAELEFRSPVVDAIRIDEARAVGVGRRQHQRAGKRRAIAPAAGRIGHRRRAAGHTVPRAAHGHDLMPAGHQLGHAERRLIRLATGRYQQDAVEPARRNAGDQRREIDDRP